MGFADDLGYQASRVDFQRLPFVEAIRDGRCPIEAVRAYAIDLVALAEGFPPLLSWILASCDQREARLAVLANLLEEEGVLAFGEQSGIVAPPGRSHGELARRFATAIGADIPVPSPTLRSAWIDDQLRGGRWLGPLAFLTVGYESNVPRTFAPIIDGLRRHYGCRDDDLVFLTGHVTADAEHGAHGIEMLVRAAATVELQRAALDGAARGTAAFYQLHRRHARQLSRLAIA
jgi:pyrroloquinoline quinone (PQQ) biosynthesis protein C